MAPKSSDIFKGNPNREIMEINLRTAKLGLSYGQYVAQEYDKRRYGKPNKRPLKEVLHA